ncbi:MAG: hypothetical protein ABII80_02555 [bacterium]
MKVILKIISLLLLWGAVVGVVLYVDPASLRDIGIEGVYLPFLGLFALVIFYTLLTITRSWKKSGVITLLLELLLASSIFRVATWFLVGVIILAIMAVLLVKKESKEGRNRD